ncbi:MAG TPA: hypothetical protein VF075_08760 [Pyrinomonadaceae bacterium]
MSKGIHLVLAVWSIIIGGYIFFITGKGWCIACGSGVLMTLGVVSIGLGLVGLFSGLKAPSPAVVAGRQ